ncbi:MAG: fluoride efflux transporter CrcB [Planctomycetota bacterium]|nr:fluoride efflux transporter CrcB [Planctomycetota bacterium]MDG2142593.1 fluoride efflux transporter CrcB [Planctomycetota bacterium]
MTPILYVGAGGFVGAVLRYGAGLALSGRMGAFPLGTLLVNAVGCFAMGALVAWLELQDELPEHLRLALGVGLLGALTTFSAFGNETLELMRDGALRLAFLSVVLNVGVGLGAVWLGRLMLTPA